MTVDAGKEGIEGASVYIKSGVLSIKAADDGINAANSQLQDWTYLISISGGDVTIDAEGDGIDSNGDIDIAGGKVVVFGSSNGGNCAIDAGDGAYWHQNGGIVAGVGISSMAESPTHGLYVRFGAKMMDSSGDSISIKSGDKVEIQSDSGESVLSFDAVKDADSIIFSADGMSAGDAYTLNANGKEIASSKVEEGTGEANMSFGPGGGKADGQRPENMPDNFTPPDFENGERPEGMDRPENMPDNFTPPDFKNGERPGKPGGDASGQDNTSSENANKA